MAYRDYAKKAGLTYKSALAKRTATVTMLVLHHAAADSTVTAVNNYHKNTLGSKGIHYNIYIHKDGTVYDERGINYNSGGVKDSANKLNDKGIHICVQGNYDTQTMPAAQKEALRKVILDCLKMYPTIKNIYGHKDLKAIYPEQTATACPGKNYPLAEMKALLGTSGQSSVVADKMPNGWLKLAGGEWQYIKDGVALIGWQLLKWSAGESWFHFRSGGVMSTGWLNDRGKWYYLDTKTGAMVTGWKKLEWGGKTDWYYFGKDGAMQRDCFIVDKGSWYYLRSGGDMAASAQFAADKSGAITLQSGK